MDDQNDHHAALSQWNLPVTTPETVMSSLAKAFVYTLRCL